MTHRRFYDFACVCFWDAEHSIHHKDHSGMTTFAILFLCLKNVCEMKMNGFNLGNWNAFWMEWQKEFHAHSFLVDIMSAVCDNVNILFFHVIFFFQKKSPFNLMANEKKKKKNVAFTHFCFTKVQNDQIHLSFKKMFQVKYRIV